MRFLQIPTPRAKGTLSPCLSEGVQQFKELNHTQTTTPATRSRRSFFACFLFFELLIINYDFLNFAQMDVANIANILY